MSKIEVDTSQQLQEFDLRTDIIEYIRLRLG